MDEQHKILCLDVALIAENCVYYGHCFHELITICGHITCIMHALDGRYKHLWLSIIFQQFGIKHLSNK